jgi:hypothetical protein
MSDASKAVKTPSPKRGKMYWKFATLEGWRAKDDQNPIANEPDHSENDEDRGKRAGSTTATPDES